MNTYPAPDNFFKNTTEHCVSLFIQKLNINVMPNEHLQNATMTFFEYQNNIYGITCKHVVEILREKNNNLNNSSKYSFFTHTNGTNIISDSFVFPTNNYLQNELDIAIRRINAELLVAIAKKPIEINKSDKAIINPKHGIAVGFPTAEKKRIESSNYCRIEMNAVHALGEINSIDKGNGNISIFSELEDAPSIDDFNGMSGGPILWSTEKSYGIMGIMKEARKPIPSTDISSEKSLGGMPNIMIFGILATPDIIINWIDELFPLQRQITTLP